MQVLTTTRCFAAVHESVSSNTLRTWRDILLEVHYAIKNGRADRRSGRKRNYSCMPWTGRQPVDARSADAWIEPP